MCGIFGLVGSSPDAPEQVFKGLTDIEYRGYDSWGITYPEDGKFKILKRVGFLPKNLTLSPATLALGHTRWATHGGVTDENAHPHSDCSNNIVLVHNGIVENYLPLKKTLKKHRFKSQTDSEVIAHLIEDQLKQGGGFKQAVAKVFNRLDGLNAIVVSNGQEIVACKIGSPLVVGQTDSGYVIASDPNALLPLTNKLLFMEDGQMVEMNEHIELFSVSNLKKIAPKFTSVVWEHTVGSMEQYPHFMLKEIYEQPQVLYNQIQDLENVKLIAKQIKQAYGTYFIGCGSAAYACLLAVYLFSKVAKKHINFSLGSEFNYTEDFLTDKSFLLAISQSGETIDIVEPVGKAKLKKAKIAVLTNTLGSTLYRMSDIKMLLQAGPEKAVASTKALLAMIANVILYAYAVANKLPEGVKIIENSAKEIESVIKRSDEISKLATKILKAKHMYVLGRGLSYPVALESALKIKEISYIHAEGFPSGELKHGPLALITKNTPVLVYIPEDETKMAVIANAMEVKARGAFVIGVGVEENPVFDFFFKVKDCGASSVLPHVVFAQFLGYFLSTKLGYNPDKPRNLAKSVVVR